MKSSLRHSLPIVGIILLVTAVGCSEKPDDASSSPSAAQTAAPKPMSEAPESMTTDKAEASYLKALCPMAHLLKKGNDNVDNYQVWKAIAVDISKASASGALVLKGDGSEVWPTPIADDVEEFKDLLLGDNSSMSRLIDAPDESTFWKYQSQWADARDPISEKRIRLELGLDSSRDKACENAGL